MPHFKLVQTAEDARAFGVPAKATVLLAALPRPPGDFEVLVYCDGACSGNGTRAVCPGGWGAVLITKGESGAQLGRAGVPHTTNNQMELLAVTMALRQTSEGTRVLVRTDSQYAIKGAQEWRAGWARKGMRNSKGEPVANADMWKALWAEVDARNVTFEWVRGHAGDAGNELADVLATAHGG